jgi:hypothetical protein
MDEGLTQRDEQMFHLIESFNGRSTELVSVPTLSCTSVVWFDGEQFDGWVSLGLS